MPNLFDNWADVSLHFLVPKSSVAHLGRLWRSCTGRLQFESHPSILPTFLTTFLQLTKRTKKKEKGLKIHSTIGMKNETINHQRRSKVFQYFNISERVKQDFVKKYNLSSCCSSTRLLTISNEPFSFIFLLLDKLKLHPNRRDNHYVHRVIGNMTCFFQAAYLADFISIKHRLI